MSDTGRSKGVILDKNENKVANCGVKKETIENLKQCIKSIDRDFAVLLKSRRWRYGNFIINLARMVLLRRKSSLPSDNITTQLQKASNILSELSSYSKAAPKYRNNNIKSTFTIGLAVTEDNAKTTAGDYFTAYEFAEAIQSELGWECRFLSRKSDTIDWYDLTDIDVIVVLIDAYDLSSVYNNKPSLIKTAWMRNWFERWASREWFDDYDIYLCSSEKSAKYIHKETGKESHVLRIATNEKRFTVNEQCSDNLDSDYCFTGSFWNAERDIEKFKPSEIDYKFSLYGHGWDKHKQFKSYYKGFINYFDLPSIYNKNKIVIDDANHVTKPWASVNSRVFDALAAGALPISNGVLGAQEVFANSMPTYNSPSELKEQIAYYLDNPREQKQITEKLRSIVLKEHTYTCRAFQLDNILKIYREQKYRIAIKIGVPNYDVLQHWGDYHFALAMKREFKKLGHSVRIDILPEWYRREASADDVVIVLRGLSEYAPSDEYINLMWNISHPDKVSKEEYDKYDHVFIASNSYAEKLASQIDTPVTPLLQCTDPSVFYPDDSGDNCKHNVLFVGNSRKQYRKIIKDTIDAGFEPAVYGEMWKDIIDKKYIQKDYIDNTLLRKYYSSCRVLLNDHWETMAENGFISNRIFDAGVCGALILSDELKGLDEVFENTVLTYNGTSEDLKSKMSLIDDADWINKKEKLREIILNNHTFEHRVKEILKYIRIYNKEKILA